MQTFIALYHGKTVATSSLVAVSTDPALVRYAARRLLQRGSDTTDPILRSLDQGTHDALRAIVGSPPRLSQIEGLDPDGGLSPKGGKRTPKRRGGRS